MTTAAYLVGGVLPVAARLLPAAMSTAEAWALVVAIGLQESGLAARAQYRGPARGFWQFEGGPTAAAAGVLAHPKSRPHALAVLEALRYPADAAAVFDALTHNDVLAAAWARLLLWTDPRRLPGPGESVQAWAIYLATWRPGRPRPSEWPRNHAAGWAAFQHEPALVAVTAAAAAGLVTG